MSILDFLPERLAIIKTRPTENEEHESYGNNLDLKIRFCSFLVHNSSERKLRE
jgi:hypothetical protein